MRILVTGGCGFIGSHQSAHLLEAGHEVCIVDDFSNSTAAVIDRIEAVSGQRPVVHELNVLDTKALTKLVRDTAPDAVIHLAGYKHVPESTERVLDYYENNVGGLLSLIRACERSEMRRLVFSSSGSVYGETCQLPIPEEHPQKPTNPYSATKSICERILKDLCTSDPSWAVVALRYFNPAGAHPSGLLGEDPLHPLSNLVPQLMHAALQTAPTATVTGDDFDTPDGSGVRDYVHVMDVVETHQQAIDYTAQHSGFLALNVGRGVGVSVSEIIEVVEEVSKREFQVIVRPRRPGDVSSLFGDTTAARKTLGPLRYRNLQTICEDAWRWQSTASATDDTGQPSSGLPTIIAPTNRPF